MTAETPLAPDTPRLIRDTCLCLHVQRAARAVGRRYDEALRPVGLSSGQFSILMSLSRLSPPTMGTLAEELAMDRTTLTANLKPLERRGLVVVGNDPRDRRARALRLTEDGRRALAEALPLWRTAQAAAAGQLASVDIDRLRASLRALA